MSSSETIDARIEELSDVVNSNTQEIQRAFLRQDVHIQVMQRVLRDICRSNELDLAKYYNEYSEVVNDAGEELAEQAVYYWIRGSTKSRAIEQARLDAEKVVEASKAAESSPPPVGDDSYEIEYFGGNLGKATE